MRDLGVGGAGWLAGGRAGLGVCGCGRAVGSGRRAGGGRGSLGSGATRPWLLPWPPRRLPPPAEGKSESPTVSWNWTSVGGLWSEKANVLLMSGGEKGGLRTSLVLASPFSEWFSSLASASAFSFAFFVFLSSFLSFTAFSFCSLEGKCGLCCYNRAPSAHYEAEKSSLPWPASWPLLPALTELVSVVERRGGKEGQNKLGRKLIYLFLLSSPAGETMAIANMLEIRTKVLQINF